MSSDGLGLKCVKLRSMDLGRNVPNYVVYYSIGCYHNVERGGLILRDPGPRDIQVIVDQEKTLNDYRHA